jgi:diaminobutyrate acetyltransferase
VPVSIYREQAMYSTMKQMGSLPKAIYRDAGKPDAAVPVINGCALPGAAIQGDVTASPIPIPTIDGALYLAAEINIWPKIWSAAHNRDLWGAGPDGTCTYRNDATGHSYGGVVTEASIEIRAPRSRDLRGIVTLVRACEPFLTAHSSYIYWMMLRVCCETCAVAERDGEIVGWWSIIPATSRKYFIHQMAIAPGMRRQGLGRAIASHLLTKLKQRHAAFELEFTVDRKNGASVNLVKAIAKDAGMQLLKTPEVVPLLEEGCDEELYLMRSAELMPSLGVGDAGNPESEVIKHRLWTTDRTVTEKSRPSAKEKRLSKRRSLRSKSNNRSGENEKTRGSPRSSARP